MKSKVVSLTTFLQKKLKSKKKRNKKISKGIFEKKELLNDIRKKLNFYLALSVRNNNQKRTIEYFLVLVKLNFFKSIYKNSMISRVDIKKIKDLFMLLIIIEFSLSNCYKSTDTLIAKTRILLGDELTPKKNSMFIRIKIINEIILNSGWKKIGSSKGDLKRVLFFILWTIKNKKIILTDEWVIYMKKSNFYNCLREFYCQQKNSFIRIRKNLSLNEENFPESFLHRIKFLYSDLKINVYKNSSIYWVIGKSNCFLNHNPMTGYCFSTYIIQFKKPDLKQKRLFESHKLKLFISKLF